MFGHLLGGKFSNKCKHSFKCIKSRIGLIRRKKQAMLKYLKKDVAELLSNGHDTNAFGRIDSLIVEINHASCYDMIERYCECILQQLPSLRKQRECPEEAMEAMSTLIFAAARFSDLPELCDLRVVFTARYGSQMESSISREFIDKVQKKKFSTEKKIQLMQYIADEFSCRGTRTFLHRLSNPSSAPASVRPAKESHRKERSTLPCEDQVLKEQSRENSGDAAVMGRKEAVVHVVPSRSPMRKEHTQPRPRDIHVVASVDNGRGPENNTKKVHAAAEGPENLEPHHEDPEGVKNGVCMTEGEPNSVGLINRMPPYTKPNIKNPSAADDGVKLADVVTDDDVSHGADKPKPFSVRNKNPKLPVPVEDGIVADDANTTSRRDHYERHTTRHRRDQRKHQSDKYAANDGGRDEEEEAIDRLLVHYSRKGMSRAREPVADGAIRAAVPAELARRRLDQIASLPSEPTTPVAEVGAGKGHARAASMSSSKGGVVHPRLPDYDELAARFIALRKA